MVDIIILYELIKVAEWHDQSNSTSKYSLSQSSKQLESHKKKRQITDRKFVEVKQ